jgi:hypothetical protein
MTATSKVLSVGSIGILLGVILFAPNSAQAGATVCIGPAGTGLCTALSGPECQVTTAVTLDPGVTIDCTEIPVRITGGAGKITVNGGFATILARSFILDSGRRIDINPAASVITGIEIAVTTTAEIHGKIAAANGGRASLVIIDAVAGISLGPDSPSISTVGLTAGRDGGTVLLFSGGDISVGGAILVGGNAGGGETSPTGGGNVRIVSSGDVIVNQLVNAEGYGFDGGQIMIEADGDFTLTNIAGTGQPKGEIDADGHGLDGYGGDIDIFTGDRIELTGPVSAAGGVGSGGGEAGGGFVGLDGGCGGIGIAGAITLTGGEGGGGGMFVDTPGPVTVSQQINANALKLGGSGGDIDFLAEGPIELTGTGSILVDGHTSTSPFYDGSGGIVILAGCQVDVGTNVLSADGYRGGSIVLEGFKSPLPSNGDFSVRVATTATIGATGSSATENGDILLSVAEQKMGTCLGRNPPLVCDADADCTQGCSTFDCVYMNPDTGGRVTQFQPAPTIRVTSTLAPCSTQCQP